jgi:hypothetical protein
MNKITIKTARDIAREVLKVLWKHDPRTINIEDQINGHLKDIDLGWTLKEGTYIDGLACTSISVLAHDIRHSAIEKFQGETK